MNEIEGKGSGADSIQNEVSSALLLLTNPKQILVVFDVGSNVGNYAQELLDSGRVKKVYCFEPSQSAYSRLNKRFSEEEKIYLCNSALSNEEGFATLFSDSDASGLASMTQRRMGHFGIDFTNSETVSVTTLTKACHDLEVIPNIIKIDVEGHELNVLQGGLEILSQVELIQFEFGGANIDTRTYFQDFWYFFRENSFELFRITPNGLKRIDSYFEEDEYFKTTNYLARNLKKSNL